MVQYICCVGCKIPPVDGYVAVCLVLSIDVYVESCYTNKARQNKIKNSNVLPITAQSNHDVLGSNLATPTKQKSTKINNKCHNR